jgi:hypothetical protein
MKNDTLTTDNEFTVNNLPCGALVTNAEHVILDASNRDKLYEELI